MRVRNTAIVMNFCAVAALAGGCGSASEDEDPAATSVGVGRYGGDCRDGDERCTDEFGAELCPVADTGYDGDDIALCDPGPIENGLLLHYGPADYDDPEEIEKYILPGFSEDENCVFVYSPNDEPVYINAYHGRMRPSSHHLIVTIVDELPADTELGEPTRCDQGQAIGSRWLLGSQDPQIDIEIEGNLPGSEPASPGDPEYGAGQLIQPNTLLRLDLHYLNTTEDDILREAWVYLQTVPEEEVEQRIDMITFFQGNINVPPHSEDVETAIGRCRVPEDRYVGMVTGHFHENGTRFTVWHEKGDTGDTDLIYETFDWDLPGNAFFTDRIENPEMDGKNIWGAQSGYVLAKKGDYINFQCEFDNPTDERVTLGELGVDQMCNVFGYYYPTNGDVWNCVCTGELCF